MYALLIVLLIKAIARNINENNGIIIQYPLTKATHNKANAAAQYALAE
jgi:hypothetical protein